MNEKQKGPLCALKGGHPHVTPHTQEALLMRLSVASLRRLVKRPLHVEFTHQELTSYSGLELLRRYLRQRDVPQRLRAVPRRAGTMVGAASPCSCWRCCTWARAGWSTCATSPAIP